MCIPVPCVWKRDREREREVWFLFSTGSIDDGDKIECEFRICAGYLNPPSDPLSLPWVEIKKNRKNVCLFTWPLSESCQPVTSSDYSRQSNCTCECKHVRFVSPLLLFYSSFRCLITTSSVKEFFCFQVIDII